MRSILRHWIFSLVLPLIYRADYTGDVVENATCADDQSKGPSGQCANPNAEVENLGKPEKRPLQWRSQVYQTVPPGGPGGIFGGYHVAAAFGEWFQGPVEHDDWDLLWTYRLETKALKSMSLSPRPGRLVNHCGYFRGAGQKCILARHIQRVLRVSGAGSQGFSDMGNRQLGFLHSYDIHDETKFTTWLGHVAADPKRLWILKGCGMGGSKGVELVRGRDVLATSAREWQKKWLVAQEYVEQPFLGYGGRKFHLRIYLLVTRWWPKPSVFLYEEGMLLRSRHDYNPNSHSAERDLFSFISSDVEGRTLTHFWQQLDAKDTGVHSSSGPSLSSGVRARLEAMFKILFGHALEESFGSAEDLDRFGFGCFDIFGADVILDADLQPMLLEINMSPNLWIDDHGEEHAPLMDAVKGPLIRQVAHWAGLRARGRPSTARAMQIEEMSLLNFTRLL